MEDFALPILDWKTDKAGEAYDFSVLFMQENHVRTILGSLLKEQKNMELLLDSDMCQNRLAIEYQHATLCNLIKVFESYIKSNKKSYDTNNH